MINEAIMFDSINTDRQNPEFASKSQMFLFFQQNRFINEKIRSFNEQKNGENFYKKQFFGPQFTPSCFEVNEPSSVRETTSQRFEEDKNCNIYQNYGNLNELCIDLIFKHDSEKLRSLLVFQVYFIIFISK